MLNDESHNINDVMLDTHALHPCDCPTDACVGFRCTPANWQFGFRCSIEVLVTMAM